MHLSVAILLGRNLCTPAAAPKLESSEEGCALTMAALAVGRDSEGYVNAWHEARIVWPWIEKEIQVRCPADHCTTTVPLESYIDLITHLFDFHVFEPSKGDSAWTLEMLADYVRTIEPKEETPVQLKFVCVDCGDRCASLYQCSDCLRSLGECCFSDHIAHAHASDSDTASAMYSGIRVSQ
jgi:hypothetical protein